MKEKLLHKMRVKRPFEKADIIIYGVCLALIIILFLSVFLLKSDDENTGFKVTVDGKVAVTFEFNKDITVEPAFNDLVTIDKNENFISVKLLTLDKNGYNVIVFDLERKTAKITESNCSSSKDCVHFPEIKASGTIYCAPHQLKVAPLSEKFKSPIAGEI